jgi:hypothetical protein
MVAAQPAIERIADQPLAASAASSSASAIACSSAIACLAAHAAAAEILFPFGRWTIDDGRWSYRLSSIVYHQANQQ